MLSVRNVSIILFLSYLVYFLLFLAVFTLLTNFDEDIYNAIGNHSLERVGLPARDLHGIAFYYFVSLVTPPIAEKCFRRKTTREH